MPSPLNNFVLLAGIDDIVPFVILALMVVGWLVNLLKENAKAAAQQPPVRGRRPGGGGDRLQNEIEIFLQEVSGKGKGTKDSPMEIVEVQRQPAAPNRPNSRKKRKPGAEFADRHRAGRADLGSNVRSHLAEHMQTGTVDSSVQRHLAHNVNQSVIEHLGDTGGASPTAGTAATVLRRRTSADAAGIFHLLRSRQGIRQAILLNEILSRPKSRRR